MWCFLHFLLPKPLHWAPRVTCLRRERSGPWSWRRGTRCAWCDSRHDGLCWSSCNCPHWQPFEKSDRRFLSKTRVRLWEVINAGLWWWWWWISITVNTKDKLTFEVKLLSTRSGDNMQIVGVLLLQNVYRLVYDLTDNVLRELMRLSKVNFLI